MVLVVTAAKPGLRGELSRWMREPHAGVFVGNLAARIRDRLWEKVEREMKGGSALMLFSARTEQGFLVRSHGDRSRLPADFDGMTLIRRTLEPKV